jgi:MoaA/NifB/PqqE/SkfB family radical SAM enzyme
VAITAHNYNMNNFYCAAPWRGLHINISGDVKTCCAGNPNMLGNLNSQSIEQILDGDKLKEIRKTLKQGIPHQAYCDGCIKRESNGGDSERSWHNSVNENFDFTQAGLDYEYPTIIDARWNNTCNLSCNYCGPTESSKWAGIKKITAIEKLPKKTNTRHYYIDVCNFIKKHYTHVKEVALVGGEPFLLPENEHLLDVIPSDCIVTLITNLSNPLENNEIFKKLIKRNRVGWSISFDNIGDRFEYVRYGSKWELMLHNLDIIQDLMKNHGHWGGIHAVYNLYNATRLCELKTFAKQRNLTIHWQHLSGPAELNPRHYGREITELAAKEIQQMYDNFEVNKQEQDLFDSAFATYIKKDQTDAEKLTKLKIFVDEIENKYHPDKAGEFARLWPEFGKLLWPQNQH